MNAYLTYAAMIGAGLYGIEHELTLQPEFKGNGYVAKGVPRMPRALYEAIGELERSEAAVEIFGQDVVDHYLNAARVEQEHVRLGRPRLGARALPRARLSSSLGRRRSRRMRGSGRGSTFIRPTYEHDSEASRSRLRNSCGSYAPRMNGAGSGVSDDQLVRFIRPCME